MKMTKLLAIGSAAAVAVASLASVASAAEQTFDMAISYGDITVKRANGIELGGDWCLSQADIDAGKTLGISNNETIKLTVSDEFDSVDYEGVVLKVTGVKGKKGTSAKTYTYKFKNTSGMDYELVVYGGDTAPVDAFLPAQFVEITNVAIEIAGKHKEYDQAMYNMLGDSEWGYWGSGTTLTGGTSGIAAVICNIATAGDGLWGAKYDSKEIKNDYPFMAVTDNGDKTLRRQEIKVLSYADSDNALSGGANAGVDGDQSYNDNGLGDTPYQFAGLASQVADFFNKQTNGTITFKFTTAASTTGTTWNNGGIPSTQVGIKNALGDATANDFAMFFNYNQTGSLQAIASVDADAGEVSFDISDVLDALGGQTVGVIDNIYYGLTKGVYYDDLKATGLKVETVTLAYDEEEEAEDIVDEEEEEEDIDESEEDVDLDEEDEDTDSEEEDVDLDDEDTDTDDTDNEEDVAGDTVVVKPAGDDSNPNTGVALAVVPAAIAAAAVVVSKKRK